MNWIFQSELLYVYFLIFAGAVVSWSRDGANESRTARFEAQPPRSMATGNYDSFTSYPALFSIPMCFLYIYLLTNIPLLTTSEYSTPDLPTTFPPDTRSTWKD